MSSVSARIRTSSTSTTTTSRPADWGGRSKRPPQLCVLGSKLALRPRLRRVRAGSPPAAFETPLKPKKL